MVRRIRSSQALGQLDACSRSQQVPVEEVLSVLLKECRIVRDWLAMQRLDRRVSPSQDGLVLLELLLGKGQFVGVQARARANSLRDLGCPLREAIQVYLVLSSLAFAGPLIAHHHD